MPDAEDDFRGLGGKFLADLGSAGLDDEGTALRGPVDVEAAVDREVIAVEIRDVEFLRIEIRRIVLIVDESVLVPCVPERIDDGETFTRSRITLRMRRQFCVTEISGGEIIRGRNNVPCRAAARNMIERGELAGDVVGFEEACRDCRAKADMARGSSDGQRSVTGSSAFMNIGNLLQTFMLLVRVAGVSATKNMSNLPRSASWARRW